MKNYFAPLLLVLLLCLPSGLYADVILTDEQAQELDLTLTELQQTSIEQETTISNLQKRNSELEAQLSELKQQSGNKEQILIEQETTLDEGKHLLTEPDLSFTLRSILISILLFISGLGIGFLI